MTANSPAFGAGIVTALITPFDDSGDVDYRTLERLLEFQAGAGVNAIFILGTAGEGLLLAPDERQKVTEFACAHASLPIAVHCGAVGTIDTSSLATHAAASGAAAIASTPPLFFEYSEDELERHFTEIAKAADGVDCYLYNNPARVGYGIPGSLLGRLVTAVPTIRGLKDTGDSVGRIVGFLSAIPDLRVYTGNNLIVLGALASGATGCVSTTANIVPELFVALYRSFNAGDLTRAREYQQQAADLQALVAGLPYVPAAKRLMQMRGLPAGISRQPMMALSAEQDEILTARLKSRPALQQWFGPVT